MNEEIQKLISEAKNICLIPSENESESLISALALFYTLKELNKNVNLIADDFPEKLSFLIPSLDFITSPKNFVISIPRNLADVSQIYYEKNGDNLKIHLTIDKGQIKKDNISFYFSDAKSDLVITLGIEDFQNQLSSRLNSFGFILGAPILNIDNNAENKKFGAINLIEGKSLSEITLAFIKSIDEGLIKKNVANCLLAGLIIYYQNFKSDKTTAEVFNIASELIKRGADNRQITDNLYKTTEKEINFLGEILKNLKVNDNKISYSMLDSDDLQNFAEAEVNSVIGMIKTIGMQNDLLVLWKGHASEPMVKGFFHSKKTYLINKVAKTQQEVAKNDWVSISMPESDINLAKEKILNLL